LRGLASNDPRPLARAEAYKNEQLDFLIGSGRIDPIIAELVQDEIAQSKIRLGLNPDGTRSSIPALGDTLPSVGPLGGGLGSTPTDADFTRRRSEEFLNRAFTGRNTFHTGGMIRGFSAGGDVPIMAQDGEFVMSRKAVSQFGVGQLSRMNQGLPTFHNGGPVYRQNGGSVFGRRSSGPQTAVVINGTDAAKELNNAIITGGETVRQSWQTLFDTVSQGLNSALSQVSTIPNQINATIAPVQIEGVSSFTDALAAQLVPKIIEQIRPMIQGNSNGGSTQQGAGLGG